MGKVDKLHKQNKRYRQKTKIIVNNLFINIILIIIIFIQIYPFILMVFGSLKSPQEFSANPGGIPMKPTLDNYYDLFKYNGGILLKTAFNSFFITTCYVALTIIISALAAYAFAKYKFKGRDTIFFLLLATMMIPPEVMMPPLFILFSKIKWINTYQIQIFPGTANVMALFILRQNMISINDSILEAAKIDGAGHYKIFKNIVVPISIPAISATCVLIALAKWNDYLWPAIMVSKTEFMPLMVILPMLSTQDQSIFSTPWELLLSGCTVATLPIIILFLLFQDKIMTSVTIGSVKE